MVLTDKLTAIADAIRAKTGKTDGLTLAQMPGEIASIETGGNSCNTAAIILGTVAETVGLRGCEVTTAEEKYYLFFEYNGVRLPRIPEVDLKSYPYWFINCWPSGVVQALGSVNGVYFSNSRLYDKKSANLKMYVLTDEEWVKDTTNSQKVNNWGCESDGVSRLLWSSHDIPKGSATATTIYFEGTEPVPID